MSETETKRKFTDSQLRVLQAVIGIISAVALLASLFLPSYLGNTNTYVTYIWLVVFVIIMFGRRWIERRFNMRLALYNLVMLDTLAIIIVIYGALMFFAPTLFTEEVVLPGLSVAIKILIVAAVALLVLIFGIILPAKRYFKRKEDGTLRPIRLPEPEEVEEKEEETSDETDDKYAGLSPLERQIMEMTRELDENKNTEDSSSDKDSKEK